MYDRWSQPVEVGQNLQHPLPDPPHLLLGRAPTVLFHHLPQRFPRGYAVTTPMAIDKDTEQNNERGRESKTKSRTGVGVDLLVAVVVGKPSCENLNMRRPRSTVFHCLVHYPRFFSPLRNGKSQQWRGRCRL